MDNLEQQHCVPCEGGSVPLSKNDAETIIKGIPGWKIGDDGKKISREFLFKDFKEAMLFVNTVAAIAESEGHHPDILIWYNSVCLELSTHAIGGLSTNDFILAAKVNNI